MSNRAKRYQEEIAGDRSSVQYIDLIPFAYRTILTNIVLARSIYRERPKSNHHVPYVMSLPVLYHSLIDQMMADTLVRRNKLIYPDYGDAKDPLTGRKLELTDMIEAPLSSHPRDTRLDGSPKMRKIERYALATGITFSETWKERFHAFCDMRDFIYHPTCIGQYKGNVPKVFYDYCNAIGIDPDCVDSSWPDVAFNVEAMEMLISFIETEVVPRLIIRDPEGSQKACRFRDFESGYIALGSRAHLRDMCQSNVMHSDLIEVHQLGYWSWLAPLKDSAGSSIHIVPPFPGDADTRNAWVVKKRMRKIIRGLDIKLDAGEDPVTLVPGDASLNLNDGKSWSCRKVEIGRNGHIKCHHIHGGFREIPRHMLDTLTISRRLSLTKSFLDRRRPGEMVKEEEDQPDSDSSIPVFSMTAFPDDPGLSRLHEAGDRGLYIEGTVFIRDSGGSDLSQLCRIEGLRIGIESERLTIRGGILDPSDAIPHFPQRMRNPPRKGRISQDVVTHGMAFELSPGIIRHEVTAEGGDVLLDQDTHYQINTRWGMISFNKTRDIFRNVSIEYETNGLTYVKQGLNPHRREDGHFNIDAFIECRIAELSFTIPIFMPVIYVNNTNNEIIIIQRSDL